MTTSYLPLTQLTQVRTLLLSCGYFLDFRDFKGFFGSHGELVQMWQSSFRDLDDMGKQIDQIIDTLLNQKSRISQENGLLLFLRVLSERVQSDQYASAYYDQITALLADISPILGGSSIENTPTFADPVAVPSDSFYDYEYGSAFEQPTVSHYYTAPQTNLQTGTYPVTKTFVPSYYEPVNESPLAPSIRPMEPAFGIKEEWQQYKSAIGSVVIPQVMNGQLQHRASGLGWLITPNLFITGWRVTKPKALRQPADLLLQMANSYVEFDQIAPALSDYASPTTNYRVQRVEYYNPSLDYMLLRLKGRQDSSLIERGFFRVDHHGWLITESELLLIQYPKVQNKPTLPAKYLKGDNKSKRIVYRASNASTVYGAPLFDVNRSVVVALHNGKNRPPRPYTGTLLSVILNDLAEQKRGLYQEIMTAR